MTNHITAHVLTTCCLIAVLQDVIKLNLKQYITNAADVKPSML